MSSLLVRQEWTEEERIQLESLSVEQRFTVEQHVELYTDQVWLHVANKLKEDVNVDENKLRRKAAKKIRHAKSCAVEAALSKLTAAAPGTIVAPVAPVTPVASVAPVTPVAPVASTISDSFLDPYACLSLELPNGLMRAKQAAERTLPTPGDWSIFSDPTLPLVVDVGCGSGQWSLRAAHEERNKSSSNKRNYLGLEIREGLVHTSTAFSEQLQLVGAVGFWHGDVNAEYWTTFVQTYPGDIVLFCCQLPDPRLDKNIRRKKGKRLLTKERILQPELVQVVVASMAPSGVVYASSDYEEVAVEMNDTLEEEEKLYRTTSVADLIILNREEGEIREEEGIDSGSWLNTNPFGLPTEREIRLQAKGGCDVFRVAFVSHCLLVYCSFSPPSLSLCLSLSLFASLRLSSSLFVSLRLFPLSLSFHSAS